MFDKKCGPGIADLWQALMVLLEELLEELQAGTFWLATGPCMHNIWFALSMPSVQLKMFTKRHLQGKLCRFKETNTSWSLKITSASFWNISIGFLAFKTFARTPSWPFNKGSRSQSHDAGVWRLRFSGAWIGLDRFGLTWFDHFYRNTLGQGYDELGSSDEVVERLRWLRVDLKTSKTSPRHWVTFTMPWGNGLESSESSQVAFFSVKVMAFFLWILGILDLDLGCERSKRVEMLMEPHWPLMLQHYRPTCRTPIFRYRTMLEWFVDDDWSRRDTETSNKCMIQLSWIVVNACKCNSGWSLR